MAMRTVEIDETEEVMVERTFVKFNEIGDKCGGFFISKDIREKTFGNETKTVTEYTIRSKEGVDQIVTGSKDLDKRMEAANPQRGNPVLIKLKARKPVPGFQSQKKIFDVAVDNDLVRIPEPKLWKPEETAAAPADDLPF